MSSILDSKTPEGPLADKWQNFKANEKLVNPANKRKFKVIVVAGLHFARFRLGCIGWSDIPGRGGLAAAPSVGQPTNYPSPFIRGLLDCRWE